MDIFAIRVINTTKVISKANTTNQSDNWEIWFTFLTPAGIEEKLLEGLQRGYNTILVS